MNETNRHKIHLNGLQHENNLSKDLNFETITLSSCFSNVEQS